MPLDLRQVLMNVPADVLAKYDFSNAFYNAPLYQVSGIVCPEHGPFKQYTGQLRKPHGAHCPACGDVVRRAKSRLGQDEFIRRAMESHDGFYTYDKVRFFNTTTKVTVTCLEHGDFEVTPNNHMARGEGAENRGRGCPVCGAAKRGYRHDMAGSARATADAKLASFARKFEEEARAIHGDTYDYSETVYAGRRSKLTIRCPQHGEFTQTAEHHLMREQGCPACSHHQSKGEAAILKFVAAFATPVVRDRSIIAPKELDIYVPEAKLAIEYCGEYWHGARAAKYEAASRTRHLEKYEACKALGIRLLTIYESEWLNRPRAIKRLIRNALGKSHGSVMARKCEARRVGPGPASKFFERYHVQGGGGTGEHYGLYYREHLVACMRFTEGANDRNPNPNRQWTLSRYATQVSVPGGASRLLSAFVTKQKPPLITSYCDLRWGDGTVYRTNGFDLDGVTPPDYWYVDVRGKRIPRQRLQERPEGQTERQLAEERGYQRVLGVGHQRWIWHAPSAVSDLV